MKPLMAFQRAPEDCADFLLYPLLKQRVDSGVGSGSGSSSSSSDGEKKGFYLIGPDGAILKPLKDHTEEWRVRVEQHTQEVLNSH
jgi:hypothetical protein